MAASPSSTEPSKKRWILGTLRAAIKKVRFLISFSATRWMLLPSIARGAPRRALSFSPRSPSLLDADDGLASPSPASSRSTSMGTATTGSVSRISSGASLEVLTRTVSGRLSSPGGDDDIDRRADEFIAKFYRQLQMERQVSLQLRYVRGNSWDRSP
jgi:hypothetical protein